MTDLSVEIRLPWWGKPYIYACCAFAIVFGQRPDSEKIANTILRHASFKVRG